MLCSSVARVFDVFDASAESIKELFVLSFVESFESTLFVRVSLLEASVNRDAADCVSLSVTANVLPVADPEDESEALFAVIMSLPPWLEAVALALMSLAVSDELSKLLDDDEVELEESIAESPIELSLAVALLPDIESVAKSDAVSEEFSESAEVLDD